LARFSGSSLVANPSGIGQECPRAGGGAEIRPALAVDYVPPCALAINDAIHPSMNHYLRDAPDA
jgi:hypothetical protein